MISSRFATVTALLLGLASIPTIIHSYVGATIVDGLTTGAVPLVLNGKTFTATGRKASWMMETLASDDWLERIHADGGEEIRLFVGRSYDAKRLYHHPELALLRGTETTPLGIMHATARPDVPLQVFKTARTGRPGIAVYALLYSKRFVERPILFQLRTSAELLLGGRKAMTLFLSADSSGSPNTLDDAPATEVLLAAIATFESQPRRPPF